MLGVFFSFLASQVLWFALHLQSSSFPKPLKPEEEFECIKLMKNGDLKARDKLISHNLRLVAHIAKKYYAGSEEMEDLISIGTIGLLKAVNTFDPDKTRKFSTYAARCVENEIRMCFRSAQNKKTPSSLNDILDTEGGGLTLENVIADDFITEENYEKKEEYARIRKIIDTKLDGKDRQIILMRYGFTGNAPMTQQAVADTLHICRSYVSRIEKRVLEELRGYIKE